MIDLNYHRKQQPKKAEPEEIFCAALAVAVWLGIIFGIMGGL